MIQWLWRTMSPSGPGYCRSTFTRCSTTPGRVKVARENLATAFGDSLDRAAIRRIVRTTYRNMAKNTLLYARTRAMDPAYLAQEVDVEGEAQGGRSQRHVRFYDFDWDVEVTAADVSPVLPPERRIL